MTDEEWAELRSQIENLDERGARFAVFYNKEGDAMGSIITPAGSENGCEIIAEGDKVNSKFIKDRVNEYDELEVKSHTLMHLHTNPGCWIYFNSYRICICGDCT